MYSTVTKRRYGAGSYVSGRWVDGTYTESTFQGSVQPVTQAELVMLPETERTKGAVKIYCDYEELRTANEATGIQADRILWEGEEWEVHKVDSWRCGITHTRAMAVRIER